ncbi:MAG: hypothetical protein OXO48_10935 [Caldilineaceae bacterium]|nr:hypothetical protein [Caldilineaceae bacterium]
MLANDTSGCRRAFAKFVVFFCLLGVPVLLFSSVDPTGDEYARVISWLILTILGASAAAEIVFRLLIHHEPTSKFLWAVALFPFLCYFHPLSVLWYVGIVALLFLVRAMWRGAERLAKWHSRLRRSNGIKKPAS